MNSTLRNNCALRATRSVLPAVAALLFAASSSAADVPFEWDESVDSAWSSTPAVTFPDAAGLDLPADYFPAVEFPEAAGLDLPIDYGTRTVLVEDDYGEPLYIVLASADPLQAP